jgi:hypothetical protein
LGDVLSGIFSASKLNRRQCPTDAEHERALAHIMASVFNMVLKSDFQWLCARNVILAVRQLSKSKKCVTYLCLFIPGGPGSPSAICTEELHLRKKWKYHSNFAGAHVNILASYDNACQAYNPRLSRKGEQKRKIVTLAHWLRLHDVESPTFVQSKIECSPRHWPDFAQCPSDIMSLTSDELDMFEAIVLVEFGECDILNVSMSIPLTFLCCLQTTEKHIKYLKSINYQRGDGKIEKSMIPKRKASAYCDADTTRRVKARGVTINQSAAMCSKSYPFFNDPVRENPILTAIEQAESRSPRPLDEYALQTEDEILQLFHLNPSSTEAQTTIINRLLNDAFVRGQPSITESNAFRWFLDLAADLGATPSHWWLDESKNRIMHVPTLHLEMNTLGATQRLLECIDTPGDGKRILPAAYDYKTARAQKTMGADLHKVY